MEGLRIPEILYTDNGSDFTSRHLEQVSADLKVRLVFSTPGVPRGRGRVERFFSSISPGSQETLWDVMDQM
jgi:putative transposase